MQSLQCYSAILKILILVNLHTNCYVQSSTCLITNVLQTSFYSEELTSLVPYDFSIEDRQSRVPIYVVSSAVWKLAK